MSHTLFSDTNFHIQRYSRVYIYTHTNVQYSVSLVKYKQRRKGQNETGEMRLIGT